MIQNHIFNDAAEAIVSCDNEKACEIANRALADGISPMDIIENGFAVGLNRVGDLFESGDMFLPELILCSETMKAVTDILNKSIATEDKKSIGKVLIATVEGDIHDIGKGIVVSLLRAHGLDVYDAGRDVSLEKIIEMAEAIEAQVIGTSALLTTTMGAQKELEEELRKRGLRGKYKTVVGGAPVTERWAKRIGADAYAEDASDGVKKIFQLLKQ
jgi:trimethylamine corrinoid protein